MNCLVKIRQIYEAFTTSEKKIADIIIKTPENAVGLTTNELAKYSETSPASVVRFAKKIGYSSYGEMKIELARNIEAETRPEIGTLLQCDDSLEIISKKIVNNIKLTLEDTLELIDFTNINQAVEKIKEADTVYLFGVGASSIVAQDLQQKLVRINKKCIFYMDYHLGLAGSLHIRPDDAVIAFSYKGNTKEVNEAVQQAKANGATCIAVTECLMNPLHPLVDILITLPKTEQEVRIGAVLSRYTQLMIVDILFTGVAKENLDATQEYLVRTRQLIDTLKKKPGY